MPSVTKGQETKPTFILRFFFEYHGGGCLWAQNEAAYQRLGFGPLDADDFTFSGEVSNEAAIKLSSGLKERVLMLDDLYAESLDWDNPSGPNLWDDNQWDDFYRKARELHKDISNELGDDFEILYQQEY